MFPYHPNLWSRTGVKFMPRGSGATQLVCDAEAPIPAALPTDEPLFDVPDGLIRIVDCDLVFAGLARIEEQGGEEVVAKTDDRGRTIDIHALGHTFGTHLSKAGVPLRTAQAAMRHSDPSLTANVYTDPKLLDVAGAVASLPTCRWMALHMRRLHWLERPDWGQRMTG